MGRDAVLLARTRLARTPPLSQPLHDVLARCGSLARHRCACAGWHYGGAAEAAVAKVALGLHAFLHILRRRSRILDLPLASFTRHPTTWSAAAVWTPLPPWRLRPGSPGWPQASHGREADVRLGGGLLDRARHQRPRAHTARFERRLRNSGGTTRTFGAQQREAETRSAARSELCAAVCERAGGSRRPACDQVPAGPGALVLWRAVRAHYAARGDALARMVAVCLGSRVARSRARCTPRACARRGAGGRREGGGVGDAIDVQLAHAAERGCFWRHASCVGDGVGSRQRGGAGGRAWGEGQRGRVGSDDGRPFAVPGVLLGAPRDEAGSKFSGARARGRQPRWQACAQRFGGRGAQDAAAACQAERQAQDADDAADDRPGAHTHAATRMLSGDQHAVVPHHPARGSWRLRDVQAGPAAVPVPRSCLVARRCRLYTAHRAARTGHWSGAVRFAGHSSCARTHLRTDRS